MSEQPQDQPETTTEAATEPAAEATTEAASHPRPDKDHARFTPSGAREIERERAERIAQRAAATPDADVSEAPLGSSIPEGGPHDPLHQHFREH